MAENSAIAWTDHTFNPWMGCQKVSAGCKHCYAETLTTNRMGLDLFGADTSKRKRTSLSIWRKPVTWNRIAAEERRPRKIFCASLADVFEDAPGPNEWRADVFEVIRACPWLDFQLLTKRPENLASMLPDDWGGGWPNIWLGTSIESREFVERARVLAEVPAIVRFISYEPALGPIFYDETEGWPPHRFWAGDDEYDGPELDLDGIDWMICGGESGPGHRPMDLAWARDARSMCRANDVAFFFKQISHHRNEQGADALGREIRQFPENWDRGDVDVHPVFAEGLFA